ncbi:MAG: HD domain-containing protein [Abditibacteriota bacterium]|nr:HD domain-containing protein [Abditibacteriota bacterium]
MKPEASFSDRYGKFIYFLGLCAAGLAINFIGARIALKFDLPIYLDVIGNILAALLGGYVPAIVVGFFTNIINSVGDYTTAYYSFISLLIAFAAAGFAKRKFFDRLATIPVVILTFALIGGGLGSWLTWILNGFWFGEGASAEIARNIHSAHHIAPYLSQLSADLLIDLLDKGIAVAVALLLMQLVPASLKRKVGFLKARRRKTESFWSRLRTRRFSLGDKVVFFVVIACFMIAFTVTAISYRQYRGDSKNQQIPLAQGVLKVAKRYIDADRINEYLEKGEAAEGYKETKDNLAHLMSTSDNIEYVYVYKIFPDGCHVVFDPDTPDTPGEKPGTIVPFDEAFKQYVPDLLKGKKIEPIENNERYGWLFSFYEPIKDSEGVCQAYVGVDIDMTFINITALQFLAKVFCLFFGFIIVIVTLAIWLADQFVVQPLNMIARATGEHAKHENPSLTLRKLQGLNINNKDEIENLYRAICRNMEDIISQIAETNAKSKKIAKLQESLITTLAEAVESRDENTGTHIKKTRAYTELIMNQLQKEGIYTDEIDETFKANVKLSAALHDVGKISVSDIILNKPGKLTDEEFAIMKKHTSYGRDFLQKAIREVGAKDADFLLPAIKLALYHHEKWNGTGYPEGLKGEEIPLPARIMAVADVFDALVSDRVYKKGFSFEKAMSIIKEGVGTHFDPNVAEAFIHAEDEARIIMESQAEEYGKAEQKTTTTKAEPRNETRTDTD